MYLVKYAAKLNPPINMLLAVHYLVIVYSVNIQFRACFVNLLNFARKVGFDIG